MGRRRKPEAEQQAPEFAPAPAAARDDRERVVFAKAWRHDGLDYAHGAVEWFPPEVAAQLRLAGAVD